MPSSTAVRGPYPVGLQERTISSSAFPDRALPTSIWYPARVGPGDEADAPHAYGQPHRATPDLPAITQPSNLILFSHGNSGTRHQSTFLTTHLASWGYVVAAPDHSGNTFGEMMRLETDEARKKAHLEARAARPIDAKSVIDQLLETPDAADSDYAKLPPLDATRIGTCGHSFGGWTAIKLCGLEPRIRALCAMAPASESFVGRRAFEPEELPLADHVETLLLAGDDDVLVDLEASVKPLYARLGQKALLESADGIDHFHFCDGIELLHKPHERTQRPNQTRPARPFRELRSEAESHDWLKERVTRFFDDALPLPA